MNFAQPLNKPFALSMSKGFLPQHLWFDRLTTNGLGISKHSAALKMSLLIALFIIPASSSAEELGRLFFTPEQRANLDYNDAREAKPDNNNRGGVLLNGIVQKHGGKRTAWINGVPQTAGSSNEQTPESMPVTLPGQTKPTKVKVGQRVLQSQSSGSATSRQNTPKLDEPKR